MATLSIVLQLLFCLGIPALMLRAEKRVRLVALLGPVIFCYAIGLLMANLPGIEIDLDTAQTIAELSAVLAIPLVLFSADLRAWLGLASRTLLSFGLCVLAAILATTAAYLVFGDRLPEAWKIGGMAIGVYTGGTPNLNAIGVALDVSPELIAKVNVADLLVSVPYLLVLFTVAQKIMLRFLPAFVHHEQATELAESRFLGLSLGGKVKWVGVSVLLSAVCLGAAIGLGELSGWQEKGGLIIVTITLLGLGFSLIKPIRQIPGSYEAGEYLLLVFCVAIGLQLRVEILAQDAPVLLAFFAMVVYGAIILHLLMAKAFRIDADTVIITSVAALFSPVFVPPIAKVLRNREIITSGMTTGVIGFAIGNFAGLLVAYLLRVLSEM